MEFLIREVILDVNDNKDLGRVEIGRLFSTANSERFFSFTDYSVSIVRAHERKAFTRYLGNLRVETAPDIVPMLGENCLIFNRRGTPKTAIWLVGRLGSTNFSNCMNLAQAPFGEGSTYGMGDVDQTSWDGSYRVSGHATLEHPRALPLPIAPA